MSRLKTLAQGALLVLLINPLVSRIAAAQGRQSGEVRGIVVDQSKRAIPGVSVTVTNIQSGVEQHFITDGAGLYDAPSVPPGEYMLSFSKQLFETFVRKGIVMHVDTVTVNATLNVGSVSQTVTVTGQTPALQTETPVVSTTLDARVVSDTPNVGRSWYQLLGLLPGVNPGGGEGASGQTIGVNGQGSFMANWQIDGGVAMLGQSQNPDSLAPPLDDIEEVDLKTANFGADHGNGFSSFNVITKSGTNRFHGSAYEYVQNDAFDALNYFAQSKTPLRWNEYGVTLGGPIKRNKAFFFVSFQNNPTITYSPAFFTFPTAAMRAGNFSDPGLSTIYDPSTTSCVNGNCTRQPFANNKIPKSSMDPVSLKIQQFLPLPNLPGLANNYYANLRTPADTKWTNVKIDYDVTPKNRLSGSYMYVPESTTGPDPICTVNCYTWDVTEMQSQITDVWTISPNLLNEFRFSFSREHGIADVASFGKGYPAQLGLANPAGDIFPAISVEGTLGTSIGYPGFPQAIDAETSFVPGETLTWVKGKHVMKFGGELDRFRVNTGWGTADAGNFDFDGIITRNPSDNNSNGEGYADFLLGLPDTWSVSINPETGGRMWSTQAFAQDEYKAKSNLTLTLGVRYVIQGGWTEVQNRLSSFQPNILNPATGTRGALWYAGQLGHTSLTNNIYDFFAPRLGFAWTPRSRLSVRGGFGIYNTIAGQNLYGPAQAWGQGWVPSGFLTSTDSMSPIFAMRNGPPKAIYPTAANRTPDLLNGQNINYSFWKSPLGYSEEYQLDVQQEMAGGVVLDVGYVGNRGIHMPYTRDINQVPERLLGPGDAQNRRPYPQYAGINAAFFDGISAYNALQTSLRKNLQNGLLFTINYVWAKSMDENTSSGFGGSGSSERTGLQNMYEPRADYAPASSDIRNLFNGNVLYELPFGHGKRWLNTNRLANAMAGGWSVSSLFQVRSGLPFTPLMGTADLSNSLSGSWRPNQIGSGRLAHPTIQEWFNPNDFVQPAPYTFGNTRRDILRGPAWKELDLGAMKDFAMNAFGQQLSLQLKAEAFDSLNTPNFGFPNNSIGTAGVGVITYSNTSRTMQFGAKLKF